jgi:catechol 2,3-dioxygenase-like lactoylglutathione lyase family enzyme
MQQKISVITLGVANLFRSRRFYADGFGWKPVFENEAIVFYQMNGLMLGTWLQSSLETDMQRGSLLRPGAFALAHNVKSKDDVVIDRLVTVGGRVLRDGATPPHGGFLKAMSQTLTIMHGRSLGILLGLSMIAGW